MKRRITEQMVKAKNPNYELANTIIDEWYENVKKIGADRLFDKVIIQIIGACYLDIDDKTSMDIIHTTIDRMALTLFTPKAWAYVKEEIIKETNERYAIKKIKTFRKKNGDFKKNVSYKVV